MQSIVTFVLILGFFSPCLCLKWNFGTNDTFYNVMDYGAVGDGQSDDSQVSVAILFFIILIYTSKLVILLFCIIVIMRFKFKILCKLLKSLIIRP